jgi:ribosomal protein S13
MAEPILSLDTLAEQRSVRIDGVDYPLRSPGQVSLVAYHKIGRHSRDIARMLDETSAADLSDDQVERLSKALSEAVTLMLDAPTEVLARLSDTHRLSILNCFTPTPAPSPAATAGPEATPATSTGESTSLGS